MPSNPLNTSGFNVSVMPNVQLANPSYFNPYGAMSQGVSQGINMGAQLQDIAAARDRLAYDQSIRPLNRQLMDVQIENAQRSGRLADIMMPGQVAQSQQPIEKQIGTFQDYDEEGNLVEYGNIEAIDPATGEKSNYTGRPLRTLKTAKQLEEESLNNEAMRSYRANMGAGSAQRAVTAAQVAAWKQANPNVKTKTYYDADMNVFEQVINQDGSLGEAVQIMLPNGQPAKRPQQQSTFNLMMGGEAAPAAAPAPIAAAPAASGDALSQLAASFAAPAATQKSFASEAEAEAAAAQGLIEVGDKIIVAGRPATWQ